FHPTLVASNTNRAGEAEATTRSFEERSKAQERSRPEARQAVPQAPAAESQQLASLVGNQAFTQVARQGEGILPDGRVQPQVQSVLATTRGGGAPLDHETRDRFGRGLGDPLHDVRVHTDDTAAALANSVSARAFTTGSDVYFGRGEYRPGSSGGDE